MNRTVFRRIERLEQRTVAASVSFSCLIRVILVHPEKGATGALVIETGKPDVMVPPTPEEVEKVRAGLEQRRSARLQWKGGANDPDDCASA